MMKVRPSRSKDDDEKGGDSAKHARSSSSDGHVLSVEPLLDNDEDDDAKHKHDQRQTGLFAYFRCLGSMRLLVLMVLCLQNSMFTVLRRYSQGVLREVYSKVHYFLFAISFPTGIFFRRILT